MLTLEEDEDSVFDEDDDGEDGGGMVNTNTDNFVDGDGSGSMGDNDQATDDDDSDPANTESVDIALRKTVDEVTSPPPYMPGQSVRFRIEVFNQGTQDITRVEVVDVFPSGIDFDAANSDLAWNYDASTRTASRILDLTATPLAADDNLEIFIFGTLQPPTNASPEEQYTNVAEVSEIDAEVGGNIVTLNQDADSPLDSDVTNNTGGELNSDDDNNITGGGPGRNEDQDNADPAFVNVALLSLGSTVFIDANNDGFQNNGDTAVAGVEIILLDNMSNPIDIGPDGILNSGDDNLGLPYVTDAEGNYFFSNLTPGDYAVQIPATEFEPGGALAGFPISSNTTSGWTGEVDPDGDAANGIPGDVDGDDHGFQDDAGLVVTTGFITLATNEEPTGDQENIQGGDQDDANGADASGNMTLDLGFIAPVTVGNFTFIDLNDNGIQDAEDAPLPQVQVTIFNAETGMPVTLAVNGAIYDPVMVTDENGAYLFEDLPPGNYYVEFDLTPIEGSELYVFSTPNSGDDDALDSDAAPDAPDDPLANSGDTGPLSAGTIDTTLDAGVVCNVSVTVGEPATLCSTQLIDLTQDAAVTPASLGGFWTTDGTGEFLDANGDVTLDLAFGVAVAYRPSAADARRGDVTLTLTTNSPASFSTGLMIASPCPRASGSVTFTILNVDCGNFFWDGGE